MSAVLIQGGAPLVLPSPEHFRHAGAAALALSLHLVAGMLLLANWQVGQPQDAEVRTIKMQLLTLPTPVVAATQAPIIETTAPAEPAVAANKPETSPRIDSRIDPRMEQQKLEQAALAHKRVEAQKREQIEQLQQQLAQERLEQARREDALRAEAEQRMETEAQQRLAEQNQAAEQQRQQAQAEAAERTRAAEAEAASRQYLPIAKQAPGYPQRALDKGIQGDCTVSYMVNPQGQVENPQIVGECHPLFIRPSLTAAKTFRYEPRIIGGRPVAVSEVKNTFHYRVEK